MQRNPGYTKKEGFAIQNVYQFVHAVVREEIVKTQQ